MLRLLNTLRRKKLQIDRNQSEREASVTLYAHKMLFSLIMLAALMGSGWIVVIYVLSFHAAQWAIDRIEGGSAPRQPQLRPARR